MAANTPPCTARLPSFYSFRSIPGNLTDRGSSTTLRSAFAAFLIGISGFRFWYASTHGLVFDEAYYWLWAKHLAPGYYDQGPGIALVIRAGLLFGSGAGCARLFAVIDAAALSVAAYALASRIFESETAGFMSGVFVNMIPLLFVGGVLITHDSPQMVTWAGAVYCIARALKIGDGADAREAGPSWWLLAGFLAGLSLDCKFTAAIFWPCGLLALLLTPRGRAALHTPWPYLAVCLTAALAIPPLYWNAAHQWASARHILNLGGAEKRRLLSVGGLGDYLGGQIAVTLFFFFGLSWSAIQSWRRGRSGDEGLMLAGAFSLAPWLLFALLSLHGHVEANWPVPAYFTAAVTTPALCAEGLSRATTTRRRWLLGFHAFSILLAVIGLYLLLFPDTLGASSTGRIIAAPLASRTNEMYGWSQLVSALETAGWSPDSEWQVAATRYQEASELAFNLPGQPRVFNLPVERRRNQFDFWTPLPEGANALVVVPARDVASTLPQVSALFVRTETSATVPIWRRPLYSRPIAEYVVVKAYGYHGGARGLIGNQW